MPIPVRVQVLTKDNTWATIGEAGCITGYTKDKLRVMLPAMVEPDYFFRFVGMNIKDPMGCRIHPKDIEIAETIIHRKECGL